MTFRAPTPPDGCLTRTDHERAVTELACELQKRASEMLTSGGRIDTATGKELALASIRARKIAADLATERERADYVAHLEKQLARLHGEPAKPARAPLRRKA